MVSAACAAPGVSLLMHGGNDREEEEAREEGREEVDREEDEEAQVDEPLNSREGRACKGPPLVVWKARGTRALSK